MNKLVMKYLVIHGLDNNNNRNLIQLGALGQQLDDIQINIDKFASLGDVTMIKIHEQLYNKVREELELLMKEFV
jgi:hypothetical protein